MIQGSNKADDQIELPPGFRFHPTDEELITHYLRQKVNASDFRSIAIGEADLNKSEPWDLPKNANISENECYFFCLRDKKYPTGLRTNRATQSGYWKATGKDKQIYRGKFLVGMKKTLVFYRGRAPKGVKSNWVMHEYRLEGTLNLPQSAKTEWVISRIFEKSYGIKKPLRSPVAYQSDSGQSASMVPQLMDLSPSSKPSMTSRLGHGHGHVPFFSRSQDELINCFNTTTFQPTTTPNNFSLTNNSQVSAQLHFVDQNIPNYQIFNLVQGQDHAMFKTEKDIVMARQAATVPAASSSMGPVDLECLWNY